MKAIARMIAAFFALACATSPAPSRADDSLHAAEAQIGAQEYADLQKQGEIIPRPSPLYAKLDPIAARIAAVADPQYDFPFHFILVHEAQPNAFAVPGGNVYVTDSLMHFVHTREELAGVLCHETSHDIHHDVVDDIEKDRAVGTLIGIFGSLTGIDDNAIGRFTERAAYALGSDHFSRVVEQHADAKGAMTCAQAGSNPWGMVWLFEHFEKAGGGASMEILSDHPTDARRIKSLEAEFRADPGLFGRYADDITTATPL